MPYRPCQTEFARLNLTYTVMSKRKLLDLVREGHVDGWDDPRMPTLSGMRRRGYPPEAIRQFCEEIGVSKRDQTIELGRLEHNVRNASTKTPTACWRVLDPLKVTITNYPKAKKNSSKRSTTPKTSQPAQGRCRSPASFTSSADDFMEDPPRKFKRLSPGTEVRLRYAYFITCNEVIKDEDGNVIELRCTYDPQTKGGNAPDGRKPKGTIHWVSAKHALDAEVRQYDHLFTVPDPGDEWRSELNPDSLTTLTGCKVEPSCANSPPASRRAPCSLNATATSARTFAAPRTTSSSSTAPSRSKIAGRKCRKRGRGVDGYWSC